MRMNGWRLEAKLLPQKITQIKSSWKAFKIVKRNLLNAIFENQITLMKFMNFFSNLKPASENYLDKCDVIFCVFSEINLPWAAQTILRIRQELQSGNKDENVKNKSWFQQTSVGNFSFTSA